MRLLFWLLGGLILWIVCKTVIIATYSNKENMCGDYTFTYGKVKRLWNEGDLNKLTSTFNEHYSQDLLDKC
jgi:hypothetical protein|tara:strand:- start:281 stop:493 length:213 start_codon:yes stop_codon:yes gene_type:complete